MKPIFILLTWMLAASAAVAQPSSAPTLQSCSALPTEAQRLQCAERLVGSAGKSAHSAAPLGDGWRLSRTMDSRSGTMSVAVTRTADIQASDVSFAGLMFRCGPARIETLLVMLDPISPSVRPTVTIRAHGTETPLVAQVLQLGTLLLLPDPATSLATASWSTATEVSFEISQGTSAVRGVVPTSGLAGALQVLRPNCINPG